MRIGILTLWQSSDNYGQQLQCWALQQALIKLGHAPYLIRYDIEHRFGNITSPLWKKILKVLLVYPVLKSLKRKKQKKNERKQIEYNAIKNKDREFKKFREKNFLVSKLIYANLKELKDNPPIADVYIVGSDQVWAHLLDKYENRAMYLDFGDKNIRRIAYAPSFSMPSYPESLKPLLKENLERFDCLSVREQTGVKICDEFSYKTKLVLDPTMLLRREDYASLTNDDSNGTYIYLYYLNISKAEEIAWNQLHSFAKVSKMQVVATPASGYIQGQELFDDVEYKYASIPKWINLIKNANLVVTTSFHGVVFCIIHHTPFVYFPLKGQFARGNNRVVDLCKMLDLSDRIWRESSSYDEISQQAIDWDAVDEILELKREDSIEYLKKALS